MKKKRQFIRTSRYSRWRFLRWFAWLVPVVNAVRAWNMNHEVFLDAAANASDPTLGLVVASLILVLEVTVASFPFFFLWWFVCTMLMSRARREASFAPTRDLEYYREQLRGLSAVQVSLLADLRIEPREDAAATLLALERRGVVSTEGEQVHVIDADRLQGLSQSDRLLVQLAAAGELGIATYKRWADLAEQEAIDGIHLRRIGKADGTAATGCSWFLRGCGTGCLMVVALSGMFALFSATFGKQLMDLLDTAETDYEMVALMVEDPFFALQLLTMSAIAVVMAVAFLLPLIDTVRGLVENGDASRHLRRTPLGEQEAECVYGIRNFLRDFTALSDADRRALFLWDDFLVYAVALGQNRQVVDELVRIWRSSEQQE